MLRKYLKEGLIAVTALGTAYFYLALIIFLLLLGLKTKALYLLVGLLICYFSVLTLRVFYFKERPEKEDYFNLFTRLNASSFPSLHTITSMYTATVLGTIVNITTITIFFYTIAVLIAFSRVYIKKHFWIDVIVGWLIGAIVSGIYLYSM